jgi:hypothetical protein
MSNRRRPARTNQYRAGYLHSKPWFARRARWFTEEADTHGVVRCAVCSGKGTSRTLELHHLDYTGVREDATGWVAAEPHEDLVAAHPRCHEWIHRLIDRDTVLGGMMSRRAANLQAITRLRAKIAGRVDDWTRT